MVTAGPTREAIDPVRYLSNASSGKMGFAVARACMEAGAAVTLISGPVSLPVPAGVRCIDVVSARDMRAAVLRELPGTGIFIAAAAVADYRCDAATAKIKKSDADWMLTLKPNPDILAEVAGGMDPPFTVGFAAETDNLLDHARTKLAGKRLSMIAANRVGLPGQGFDADDNALHVIWPQGEVELPRAPKGRLARQLVSLIAERFHAAGRTQDP
jgi:phosphopantothenoylcysteine decarboxylase/phosphopantothenate--cysteine ligase